MNKKVSLAQAVITTWVAIAIVALVIGAVKLMPYYVGSDTGAPEDSAGATPSAAPTSRGDQCVATVMDLLSRTLQGCSRETRTR